MKVFFPSKDLNKGLHSVLGPSFWVYDGKGPCPSGKSGKGQGPFKDLCESSLPFLG